ncbi:hypothetical protein [Streptomyces sp. ICC1]|uniref:hypothetical protein n=1 Tax=Streptomyces sp. ICC1 TaxID=2099583 RepID=UPI000DC7B553|nr:hypothetical protein [Streptomyces sp. ICC1]AWZ15456.1 hypothetical protein DRB96_27895 [Streptomyces sp. ICC1]
MGQVVGDSQVQSEPAVFGKHDNNGTGVYGETHGFADDNEAGVYGVNTGGGPGVRGVANVMGPGVKGTSLFTGVEGVSSGTDNDHAVGVSGTTRGRAERGGGGARGTVLPAVGARRVAGSDGNVYGEGGSDASHWDIHRIALDAQDIPRATKVLDIPQKPAVSRRDLAFAQGVLSFGQPPDRTRRRTPRVLRRDGLAGRLGLGPVPARPGSGRAARGPDGLGRMVQTF